MDLTSAWFAAKMNSGSLWGMIVFVCLGLICGCSGRSQSAAGYVAEVSSVTVAGSQPKLERLGVSMFELLAQPEAHSGQIVTLTGYLKVDVEEQLLYASAELGRADILEDAVVIDTAGCTSGQVNDELQKRFEGLRDSYVRVTGRFMKTEAKSYPYQSGKLCSIQSVKVWRR